MLRQVGEADAVGSPPGRQIFGLTRAPLQSGSVGTQNARCSSSTPTVSGLER